ncbi:hypothetical protein [Undibacterium sp.]|uniref:hypothetical protein n=1 Tax=Undibacterium sp. TaxID=1914977 RepID=UPI0025F2D96C|nr:hypothetical protein [Undibacterium sp.]
MRALSDLEITSVSGGDRWAGGYKPVVSIDGDRPTQGAGTGIWEDSGPSISISYAPGPDSAAGYAGAMATSMERNLRDCNEASNLVENKALQAILSPALCLGGAIGGNIRDTINATRRAMDPK